MNCLVELKVDKYRIQHTNRVLEGVSQSKVITVVMSQKLNPEKKLTVDLLLLYFSLNTTSNPNCQLFNDELGFWGLELVFQLVSLSRYYK